MLACVGSLIAACSGAPGGSAAAPAGGTTPVSATAHVAPGNVCERKLLDASRLDGILEEPITGSKPLSGDAQTCYFITASNERGGPEVTVSLRPGMGRTTIATFTSGHMNEYAQWKPLGGVGDAGVWLPALHEVQAQKDDVLCDISARGMSKALSLAGESAQQQRLGGLCNEIFVALKLMSAAPPAAGIKPTGAGNLIAPACDQDLQPGDVATIITAPVAREPGYGAQSCTYRATGKFASITISLAAGDDGKFVWDTASNPANGAMAAMAGSGDAALQGRGGTYVVARKGDLVCSIDLTGTDNGEATKILLKERGDALAAKLGALCAKVFAAR